MYHLLKTQEGELRYKKAEGVECKKGGKLAPTLYPKISSARPGVYGFDVWMQTHHLFVDWLVDEFVEHATSINAGINKVKIDIDKLTYIMGRRLYATSYNKERAYTKIV